MPGALVPDPVKLNAFRTQEGNITGSTNHASISERSVF